MCAAAVIGLNRGTARSACAGPSPAASSVAPLRAELVRRIDLESRLVTVRRHGASAIEHCSGAVPKSRSGVGGFFTLLSTRRNKLGFVRAPPSHHHIIHLARSRSVSLALTYTALALARRAPAAPAAAVQPDTSTPRHFIPPSILAAAVAAPLPPISARSHEPHGADRIWEWPKSQPAPWPSLIAHSPTHSPIVHVATYTSLRKAQGFRRLFTLLTALLLGALGRLRVRGIHIGRSVGELGRLNDDHCVGHLLLLGCRCVKLGKELALFAGFRVVALVKLCCTCQPSCISMVCGTRETTA